MAETKGRECFNIFNVGKKSSKQINEKKIFITDLEIISDIGENRLAGVMEWW